MSWRPRILIAEDHPPDRELVAEALVDADLSEAHTLAATIEGARGSDLVVLDLGLPDSHGPSTLERFLEAHPDVPVVVLTGTDDASLGERLVALGAEDYVPKRGLAHRLPSAVMHALVRRERARATEEARAIAHAVLAESPTGFALFTADRRVAFHNRSWRRILEIDEASPEVLPDVLATAPQVPGTRRQRVRLGSGRVRWLQVQVSLVDLDDAERLMAIDDVTEAVELESQLAHAQRLDAMGRLAGGVAHDLNNCLTAIRAFAQFARDATAETRESAADLDEVLAATARAEGLTSQLLAFSRRQPVTPAVVSPADVAGELTRMLDRVLGDRVELLVTRDPETPCVWIDQTALEQVIVNLVVNARDALGGQGHIYLCTDEVDLGPDDSASLGLAQPGRYARVRVRDDGCGMSPAVLKHAFEPFFTTKPGDQGTGLGLATSYGLIVQAGGLLTADSSEGQGTTMTVLLPAHDDATSSNGEAVTTSGDEEPVLPGRVLLVEDDPSVLRVAQRALLEAGHDVLAASDGERALSLLDGLRDPVDLVVTDLQMPGMGGRQLAEALRGRESAPRMLFVSSLAGELPTELPGPFLQKPFRPESLRRAVADLLAATNREEVAPYPPLDGLAQVDDGFDALLGGVQATRREDVVFGAWADGRLAYFNDAYVRFAIDNGAPSLPDHMPLGSDVLDVVPSPVQSIYRDGWSRLLAGQAWYLGIECNGPDVFRSIVVHARPLRARTAVVGVLFQHHVRTIAPMHRPDQGAAHPHLVGPNARLCVNCARTADASSGPTRWVWVSANLDQHLAQVDWGLCDRCEASLVLAACAEAVPPPELASA